MDGSKSKIAPEKSKLKWFFSNVTVEPTVFLFVLPFIMVHLISQNLYLEKACRIDIGLNVSTCDAMTRRDESGYSNWEEAEVQKLVSQMFALKSAIQGIFPVFIIIFVGSWSDRHNKRKPVILTPIVGLMISCFFLAINAVFFDLPLILTVLSDAVPFSIFGGLPCFYLGAYSYIGSRWNIESRTLRCGLLTITQMCSSMVGTSIAGVAQEYLGFKTFFALCEIILAISFIFGLLLIDEPERDDKEVEMHDKHRSSFFIDFFNVKYFSKTIKVCLKKEANKRRLKILVLLIISATIYGPTMGEISLTYLYTRYRFGWDAVQFGMFFGVHYLMQIIGSLMGTILLSKVLHFHDSVLGMMSFISSVMGYLIYSFASNGLYFSIGVFSDLMFANVIIALKSLTTKVVRPNELGQLNSVFGVWETLLPSVFGPFYSILYKYSIEIFPGSYFFVSCLLKLLGLFSFYWLYKQMRKEENSKTEESLNLNPSV